MPKAKTNNPVSNILPFKLKPIPKPFLGGPVLSGCNLCGQIVESEPVWDSEIGAVTAMRRFPHPCFPKEKKS